MVPAEHAERVERRDAEERVWRLEHLHAPKSNAGCALLYLNSQCMLGECRTCTLGHWQSMSAGSTAQCSRCHHALSQSTYHLPGWPGILFTVHPAAYSVLRNCLIRQSAHRSTRRTPTRTVPGCTSLGFGGDAVRLPSLRAIAPPFHVVTGPPSANSVPDILVAGCSLLLQ
eukprot:1767929-Rhodomonas_salina.4